MSDYPITVSELKRLVRYDPTSGSFTAIVARRSMRVGVVVGTKNRLGYIVIRLDRKLYLAHRLGFLYMTGEWPTLGIDHRNGDRADNRWTNLRLAEQKENVRNSRIRTDNTSGHKGVRYRSNRGHWYAVITVDGAHKYLGSYKSAQFANEAYKNAAVKFFGEFARVE